jgi:hypothetical protein
MNPNHYFVTADAESDLIEAGIRVISEIREEAEARWKIRIPVVWFVRFQRSWTESVANDSAEAFEGPVSDGYDGFALARSQLVELIGRGDEIGWHYHAYSYVHRDDLSHETRMEILRADLTSCARELRRLHPEFPIGSFRFGWRFVPDYTIYDHLKSLGIGRDASIDPRHGDDPVGPFSARFLPPLVKTPTRIGDLSLFPYLQTVVVHDWKVLAHDFGWSRSDESQAAAHRRRFAKALATFASRVEREHGEFVTYETASASMIEEPARG